MIEDLYLDHIAPCEAFWGRAEVYSYLPNIRIVRNAIYIPWSHGGPWGVFTSEGHPIAEAINYRDTERVISGPEPYFPSEFPQDLDCHPGTIMYMGYLNPHYGHFIINTLPRFWPLLYGREKLPELCCHVVGTVQEFLEMNFAKTIFASVGLTEGLNTFDRPLRISTLLVPDTSLHEQFGVHRIFGELCKQVGRDLWREDEVDTISDPLYLSKTRLKIGVGRFADEERIVAKLSEAGATIFFPEEHTFADQVATMARHKTIIGTTGSAFHTSIFSAPARKIIGLSPTALTNTNYTMLDIINKNRSRYFFPKDVSYSHTGQFQTTHHPADPEGIAADLIKLLS
jgi:capsular polysaccharide biosynthesis protein